MRTCGHRWFVGKQEQTCSLPSDHKGKCVSDSGAWFLRPEHQLEYVWGAKA